MNYTEQSKDKQERIQYLVDVLNRASESYYAKDEEIMSNLEYDRLYDELVTLERETGYILENSPTRNVGYESVDFLPKERHEKPMLSLGKTKEREELRSWLNGHEGLLSWKLDGLTIVLTYRDGILEKAVTRGNGEIGEVITANARTFLNVPKKIDWAGEVILRGEAVITYSDFEKINESIENPEDKYKNPRNLCSGSVRQLNSGVTAKRNVRMYAFNLVKADGFDAQNQKEQEYLFMQKLGFDVVEYVRVTENTILEEIENFANKIQKFDVPSDGLVLTYDDISYGKSLGMTAKFPRDSIAFKWADEEAETVLREIEWSPSRTGLINPVAIFDSVDLEGTTVSRASVHNVSVMRALKLGIGDRITVYKANMIIPQIAENLTQSNAIEIPSCCPTCGGKTELRSVNEAETLYCTNPDCDAKKVKSFALFVSRDAMNIDGMSEATLEKFLAKGYLHEFADLYRISRFRDEIVEMEGFGEKSYQNMIDSINKSKETTLPRLIYGLGIANIGVSNAKLICKHYDQNLQRLMDTTEEELAQVERIGDVIATAFVGFMQDSMNRERIQQLMEYLHIEETAEPQKEQTLSGMGIVITGSLNHFARREDLQERIESLGGKPNSSVSAKTAILINNDSTSNSSKNKKAKELGIPIMTEEEFMDKYLS